MKKFLSVVLVALTLVALCIPGWAEEPEEAVDYPLNAEPAMDMSLETFAKNNKITEEPTFDEAPAVEPYSPEVHYRTIFGEDGFDLQPVNLVSFYPDSAIAKIVVHFRCGCAGQGTGFMVSAEGLMTAAHCLVCDEHHKTADSLTFYFGYINSKKYDYKYDGEVTFWYGTDFSKGPGSEWDYGYVKFKKRIGGRTGWFGLWALPGEELNGLHCLVHGYRGDSLLWDMGKISVFTPYLLKSRIDLLPGMSGGPVSCLVMDHGIYYYAVGINVGETAQANYARRITSELISEMEENGLFDRGMTGDAFPKP